MKRLFNALLNQKELFLNAKEGQEFEQRIMAYLITKMRYNRIERSDVEKWAELKPQTIFRSHDKPIQNSYGLEDMFIYQPNGSQDYPDFLVFMRREVVCVESKFAGKAKPVWNSGLPRPNGFYILGRPDKRDITFFRGCDVITREESEKMHGFFDNINKQEQDFNRAHAARQKRGFAVSIRKAFEQKKLYNPHADLDYYESPDRGRFEQSVITYFARHETSE